MTIISKRIGRVTELPVDTAKIKRHESEITGLELFLEEDRSGINAKIFLRGFSKSGYQIRRWDSNSFEKPRTEYLEQAQREYQAILKKFKRGEYRIDIYGDGKVEVNLLD